MLFGRLWWWWNGSYSWQALHSFAIPPVAFTNGLLPSIVSTMSWCTSASLLQQWLDHWLLHREDEYLLSSAVGEVTTVVLWQCSNSGLYMLNTDVLEFCFPRRVTVVHLPNPCGSSPLVMIADEIFPMRWWQFRPVCSCYSMVMMNPRYIWRFSG